MKRSGLFSVLFLGLAACGPTGSPAPETTVSAPEAPAMAPDGAVAETTPPEPLLAASLTGLNPRQVQEKMGEPTLVRRDGHVQVMLFEKADCVLEVVFYEPATDAWFEARTINARTAKGMAADADTCLARQLPSGRWHNEH
ncbi:MAG: hypothetical protein EP335_00395 [Alphaproteobacteria bacterium]|nr:MAG: hypothetical protein EP335_00395 [Alphaproteobacteria bacterium]